MNQNQAKAAAPQPAATIIPLRGPMKATNYFKLATYEGGSEQAATKVTSHIFPFCSESPGSRKRALEALWAHPQLKGSKVSVWKKGNVERFPEIGAGI